MARSVKAQAAPGRVFKTEYFAKLAKKAGIADKELCEASAEVRKGQCDDLGGGVFKKRLNKNLHRGLVLSGRSHWFWVYLFAKKDRDNIEPDDLVGFRTLAKDYESLTKDKLKELVDLNKFMEICNELEEPKVQK